MSLTSDSHIALVLPRKCASYTHPRRLRLAWLGRDDQTYQLRPTIDAEAKTLMLWHVRASTRELVVVFYSPHEDLFWRVSEHNSEHTRMPEIWAALLLYTRACLPEFLVAPRAGLLYVTFNVHVVPPCVALDIMSTWVGHHERRHADYLLRAKCRLRTATLYIQGLCMFDGVMCGVGFETSSDGTPTASGRFPLYFGARALDSRSNDSSKIPLDLMTQSARAPEWCNDTAALYVIGKVQCTINHSAWFTLSEHTFYMLHDVRVCFS